jgi:hypothetical protein
MRDQTPLPLPPDLDSLSVPKLSELAERLTNAPRGAGRRIKLLTISSEVRRRLGSNPSEEQQAALQQLEQTVNEWLENDRHLQERDDDDEPRGGLCMCSTARFKS